MDINALTITPRLLPKREGGKGESVVVGAAAATDKGNGRAEVEVKDAGRIEWDGRSLRNRTVRDSPAK